ncbi:MAG: integrase [Myxococcaceae bacterium]|nr:integrase [Myxococcaceae bacterium]
MKSLQGAIERYIELRKSVGYGYRVESGILRRFGAFAGHHSDNRVRTATVLQWAEQMQVAAGTAARAVSVVRTFAVWHAAEDPLSEVPPTRLFPGKTGRKRPFLHSDEQVMAVLEAARGLSPHRELRGITYSTVFALIAVTGMRISEAINLNRADVDLASGVLTITMSKFKKSRILPLHKSATRALVHYSTRRDSILGLRANPAFFLSDGGKRLLAENLQSGFAIASRRVGQRAPTAGASWKRGRGPRVHDLRHRFAVETLLDWYRAGLDVEREMPKLVTYLGHSSAADTHWYLEAVPELLQLASERVTSIKSRR